MAIINKALKKNLDERYDSARAMQRDLEEVVASSGSLASVVTDYVGDLFPEESDPDRALTRAILSGDLRQQNTPSHPSLRSSSSSANVSHLLRPPPRSKNWLLIGASVAAFIFAAVTVVALVELRQGTLSAEVADIAQPAQPTVVPPAVHPAGAAPAPVAEPVVVAPPPDEPAPVPPPLRRPAPKRHHERVAGGDSSPSHVARPPGTLALRVAPWAEVFLDGQRLGTTPMEPVSVPSGMHKVKLVNNEIHATKTLTVEVKPGETALVKAKLE
jgi:eukaryotic-like serine/threonine-protein kinase